MDEKTIRYYDDNAESIVELYGFSEKGIAEYFPLAFSPGSEILDIGSGSGRDLEILIRENFEAYGTEPSEQTQGKSIIYCLEPIGSRR
jgi:SAM-dependent methyltransferase